MFEIGKLGRLTLGYVNENKARVIDVDMTGWLEDFPDGHIGLLIKRPWEDAFYPVDLTWDGNVAIWIPKREDLEISGEGEAQYVLTNDEGVELRSRVVKTKIDASMTGTEGDVPPPGSSFVQDVINAAAQAEAAVEKMPSIGENGNWYGWDATAGAYVDTGKPSRGEQGERGPQGDPGPGGKDGSPGADGQDGADGKAATVKVGKVKTLPAGSMATVTNSGTETEAVLDFGIPKGADGDGGGSGSGEAGEDGGYYEPNVSNTGELTWTPSKADMPSVASVNIKGPTGAAGKDGTSVTVASVSTSSADGGDNVVTFSDGKTLTVKNGSKGSTPAKGTDYWTASDRQSMVNDVVAALPKYNGEVTAV